MCRYRQIQDTFAHCNHTYLLPDEMVYCPDRFCRFGPNHPTPSTEECGPNCKTTCWQYRQFPEQILRRLDRLCPPCQREHDQQLQQQNQQQQNQHWQKN